MLRVLLVDNYDSFAYNLAQALRVLGAEVEVFRNDAITADEALGREPDRFVVSPGPCSPDEAGISVELCRRAAAPLLGVCLGHQSLVQAFGGRVGRAPRVMHGKASPIAHDGRGLFSGLPSPFPAARYHSLAALEIPSCFEVTARTADHGELMALRHRGRPLHGVQFHPESYLTPLGGAILRNFLESPTG
ncbi:MAG TPA: aminodeoxychorismate/anthranilate synthase component II [Planctomycetota bacterium]|nr:aminodeoxychorismate/anthranilate synthase component II [Planctomycetota bacterium]